MIEESRVKRIGDARTIYRDNVLNEQRTSRSTVHLPSRSINSNKMSPEAEDSPHVTGLGWSLFRLSTDVELIHRSDSGIYDERKSTKVIKFRINFPRWHDAWWLFSDCAAPAGMECVINEATRCLTAWNLILQKDLAKYWIHTLNVFVIASSVVGCTKRSSQSTQHAIIIALKRSFQTPVGGWKASSVALSAVSIMRVWVVWVE